MKKLIISGVALLLLPVLTQAQTCQGLDSIIVEKYYVSDLADKAVDATGGVLPVNSVTYRIFVDMKPGYKFQAAYGVDKTPTGISTGDHQLRIATTTMFWNNEDRGAITPAFTKAQAANNTVMLDSWVSVGGATNDRMGILKADDDGVATNVNGNGVLQNNNPEAGIPLTTQDGFIAGTPEAVTIVGMSSDLSILDATTSGNLVSTYNGSWASLNGSVGPTADNRVLIAQITTDGALSFQLNIQLGTPTPGGTENWVANNPEAGECTHPSLSYLDSLHTTVVKAVDRNTAASVALYPNPTNGSLNIDINKTTQTADNSYSIYAIDGKVVASGKMGVIADRHKEKVDLSALAPGFYFVEISLDGNKTIRKITKN